MKKIRLAIVMILTLSMVFGSTAFAAPNPKAVKSVTPYEEYSSFDINGNMFLIVLVRNDSMYDRAVYMDASSYTSSGKKLETVSSDLIVFGSGESYGLVATFTKKSDSATNYDYNLIVDTAVENYLYQPCTEFIDAKFSDDGNGTVTVYATNKSTNYTVETQAIVLFYYDDQLVDFVEMYLSNDSDCLLSPGEKTTEKGSTSEKYNASEILINATS